ncbi:sodium/potassium-transporting ATPase subunit beta-2 [Lingula anatina]|uniref:Sodium/potassium-transporting ATPase subunit beta-2 n=1 Tax=Lingula anatina TaxID=7574 RepID=A0A1S3HP29_LINAN|nr:sodium/potassium-transporting ATPase subunit beta-2 [Lingula anatina]|eukprot:XP_013387296.1 sodium/potassium-transporting ATPase subunit beta-2 [Lingula anatina]
MAENLGADKSSLPSTGAQSSENLPTPTKNSPSQLRKRYKYSLIAGIIVVTLIIAAVVGYTVGNAFKYHGQLRQQGLLHFPAYVEDPESTLILFRYGKPSSFSGYTDQIEGVLRGYSPVNQSSDNVQLCISGPPDPLSGRVCYFPLRNLGGSCTRQEDYGFDEASPCVLLMLNGPEEWTPNGYTEDTVPKPSRGQYQTNYSIGSWESFVGVRCEFEEPADIENGGPISFYPAHGFSTKYFPFQEAKHYRSPLVMVKFDKPNLGVLFKVTCRALARNINPGDKRFQTTFSIRID